MPRIHLVIHLIIAITMSDAFASEGRYPPPIPQRPLECEVRDVKRVDESTGLLSEVPLSRFWIGQTFLVDTRSGVLSAKGGLFDMSNFAIKVIDDGQSAGQWYKVTYTAEIPMRDRKVGNIALLTIQSTRGMAFTLADQGKTYSGLCK